MFGRESSRPHIWGKGETVDIRSRFVPDVDAKKWLPIRSVGAPKLFHICGKAVEKMSDGTRRWVAGMAFERSDRAKAAHVAESA